MNSKSIKELVMALGAQIGALGIDKEKNIFTKEVQGAFWGLGRSFMWFCYYPEVYFPVRSDNSRFVVLRDISDHQAKAVANEWVSMLDADGLTLSNDEPEQKMSDKYPAYFKDVSDVDEIDVYQTHQLFNIQDPSGCLQQSSKKILLSGVRTGGKSKYKDIKEARDSLNRWLEINANLKDSAL